MRPRDPLLELLDEARAGQASSARVRERWLQRQAEESATLAGTLLDLAEQRTVVGIGTRSGRSLHGEVLAVGADVVVLRAAPQRDVCLRLEAITTVRPAPGARHVPASGDRPAPLDLLLVDVLSRLCPERPRLAIVSQGGEAVAGELRSVGTDVVTVRLDAASSQLLCYVAVATIDEVGVEGR